MSRKFEVRWFWVSRNVALICSLLVLLLVLIEYSALLKTINASDLVPSPHSQQILISDHNKTTTSNSATTSAPTASTTTTTTTTTTSTTSSSTTNRPSSAPSISPTTPRPIPALKAPRNTQSSANMTVRAPKRCRYGKRAHYGGNFSEAIRINLRSNRLEYNISRAFGCGIHHRYCTGKIKAIPCCTKIMYDMWYALDKYFTKHDVTYSLHWGSLLMAVRDGRHAPWDPKDIDLGFLWPSSNARAAIDEFIRDYSLHMTGLHHIRDWEQTFFVLHHEQYGYPRRKNNGYCFYDQIYVTDQGRGERARHKIPNANQAEEIFEDPNALILAGTVPFIDFTIAGQKSDGIGNFAKHLDKLKYMITVQYKGPHGLKPPRQMWIFADFYKQLYTLYGDTWPDGYTFLSEKQRRYYGLPSFDNSYFKTVHKKTIKMLDRYPKKWNHSRGNDSIHYQKFRNLFQW